MTWIIIAVITYIVIGIIAFSLVRLMDGYNPNRWVPTFILTVFLWPLILLIWSTAAIFESVRS